MSNILITGGAGYIGSHTALELLNQGYQVTVFDNLSNSSVESLKRVEELTGKSITFYEGDLLDAEALKDLRAFMFTNLYKNPIAKGEEKRAESMLGQLYTYYMEHPEILPEKFIRMHEAGEALGRVVCDFISGMTDQFALNRFNEYYLPKAWQVDGF